MIDVEWLFERADGSVTTAILQEGSLPAVGDGKIYQNVGYEVRGIIANRYGSPPLVTATEDLKGGLSKAAGL